MKTLFVFQIQSFTDVVTNSSSELFVFTGTTGVVSDMLDSNVPGWEHEYDDPQSVQDLSPNSLETIFLMLTTIMIGTGTISE